MDWQTVARKHTRVCERRQIARCFISKPFSPMNMKSLEASTTKSVPLHDNDILDEIMDHLTCLCPCGEKYSFIIAPSQIYKITVKYISNKHIRINQHWVPPKYSKCGPSVRKVIITFS